MLLLLGACVPNRDLLTRYEDALAQETADAAGPSVTAALKMGGLAAEVCILQKEENVDWNEYATDADDADKPVPPFSPILLAALGAPVVYSVESLDAKSFKVTLSGLEIMDRARASARFVSEPADDNFAVDIVVLDGQIEDTASGSPQEFGRVSFTVGVPCVREGRNLVTGRADWTDLTGRAQRIAVPASDNEVSGVSLDPDLVYVPVAGAVSWVAEIDGGDRTVVSADGEQFTPDGDAASDTGVVLVSGRWPARVVWDDDKAGVAASLPIVP